MTGEGIEARILLCTQGNALLPFIAETFHQRFTPSPFTPSRNITFVQETKYRQITSRISN